MPTVNLPPNRFVLRPNPPFNPNSDLGRIVVTRAREEREALIRKAKEIHSTLDRLQGEGRRVERLFNESRQARDAARSEVASAQNRLRREQAQLEHFGGVWRRIDDNRKELEMELHRLREAIRRRTDELARFPP
jgi:chromosome segregation ATPase